MISDPREVRAYSFTILLLYMNFILYCLAQEFVNVLIT